MFTTRGNASVASRLQPPAHERDERWESGFERREHGGERARRMEIVTLLTQDADERRRVAREQAREEAVRRDGDATIRHQAAAREVLEIVGDDPARPRFHGGGEDMPIVRVRGKRWDKGVGARYERVGEGNRQLREEMADAPRASRSVAGDCGEMTLDFLARVSDRRRVGDSRACWHRPARPR